MTRARDVADKNLAVISAGNNGQILTSDGTNWSAQNAPTEVPAHGANGNVLTSDGSQWTSAAPATVDTDLVNDTSPQLGGDLDMQSHSISNGVLGIKNTGTQSELRLYCESNNAHYVGLKAPAHSAFSGNHSITMPPNTGNSGEFLKTDGNGVTSWAAAGGGSWDLLATTTVSATQNLDFRGSSIFDNSTYGMYCAVFANCNVNFSGNTGSLRTTWLRNGTQAVTQDIIYSQVAWYSSLETSNSGSGNTGYAQLIANDGPGAIMGQVWFTLEAGAAAGSNTGGPAMTWQITENTGFLGNGRAKTAIGHAFINQAYWNTVGTGIDGIRFYTEYSNWHSGKIYMYGLKK